MKKFFIFLFLSVMAMSFAFAQQKPKKFYDETKDPIAQIDEAVKKAKAEGKYVVCQLGGNWCPWCIRFGTLIQEDEAIRKIIDDNFVYIHVNYTSVKDEKSKIANNRLANAGRFGFPVIVVLREDGSVMHIQNSSYLEEGKGYNRERVQSFFQNWTREAVNGQPKR